MKPFLLKFFHRGADLANVQPILALFLGGALLALVLAAVFRQRPNLPQASPGWFWAMYDQLGRLIWASLLVLFLVSAISMLRTHLRQTVGHFQHSHGRITGANYHAVQTIWGAEQIQNELRMEMYHDEEVTERIEFEDLTKPTILRKKSVRHFINANPFVSARHEVTLRQNPRKKGSALYGGYETTCHSTWRLRNPTRRELKANLTLPLPAAGAMYDDLAATLNGADILPQMQLKDATLLLVRDLKPEEALDITLTFKSRGMSYWYFQVKEAREIRDFTLKLTLTDLPKWRLNYPEGCMTPTEIQPTADGRGSVLTYRLDHAIASKGMGVALPSLPQPGATTNAVLGESERAWMLIMAMLLLGFTGAALVEGPAEQEVKGPRTAVIDRRCKLTVNRAVLLSVLFGAATAFGYGLLGDFSDLLFGFWGTAGLILLPLFLVLSWLLTRVFGGAGGKLLALQLLLYGLLYPCLAGLDADRQTLYFNLCALIFLAFATWQLLPKAAAIPTTESAVQSGTARINA